MLKKTLLTLGVAAMIAGCTTTNKTVLPKDNVVTAEQISATVFVDKNGGVYTLNTADNYETAKFTDTKGDIYSLKRQPSANGIRLVDGKTEVFFTKKDAFITVDGKEIPVTIKEGF